MESKAVSLQTPHALVEGGPGAARPGRGRAWRAASWLAAGLALLIAGDRGGFTATANGIDPLEVLDLTVKNNVLFIIDTSGSMSFVGDGDKYVGGDDPASRMFQAKQAVKQVVKDQNGKINMGLLSYNVLNASKTISPRGGGNPGTGLTYVSVDARAADWNGFFNDYRVDFADYNNITNSAETFRSFRSNIRDEEYNFNGPTGGYPSGCLDTATQLTPINYSTPSVMRCRRYMQSQLYRNNMTITWDRSAGNGGMSGSPANFDCPLPPAALFPNLPDGPSPGTPDGFADVEVPCFQLVDKNDTTKKAIFYYSSPHFAFTGSSCGGAGKISDVSPCADPDGSLNAAVIAKINNAMDQEMPLDADGKLTFAANTTTPARTGLAGELEVTYNTATGDLPAKYDIQGLLTPDKGIRAAQSTPLAASLSDVRNASPAFFPARPTEAIGLQKNFVILVTDGDDTCTTGSNDDNKAVNAARAASDLFYEGKTSYAAEPSVARHQNQAETIVVAFGGAVTPDRANVIAQGGSGATIATGTPSVTTAATCPTGVTCRNAFQASDTASLVKVLNDAIAIAASTGTFSASPTITESIFEYISFVSPSSPLDPERRYNYTVPVLFQPVFTLPGFKGTLKAFIFATDAAQCTSLGGSNFSGNTCELWNAGQRLVDRVTKQIDGATCVPASTDCMLPDPGTATNTVENWDYTFAQLYGSATLGNAGTNQSLRIRRRIFTTSKNGVDGNSGFGTAALWPPDTTATGVDPANPTPAAASTANPAGALDVALGITAAAFDMPKLKTDFRACENAPTGHACLSATAADALRAARREAREVILANIAGAKVALTSAGVAKRNTAGAMLFVAKDWMLAESTLASPAILTPTPDQPTDNEKQEWFLYRDGPRDATTKKSIDKVALGYGLRNPDKDADTTSAANLALKPAPTIAFYPANDGLHALRAGPCNAPSGAFAACNTSTYVDKGGEELWNFVPYDQLGKLKDLVKSQTRATKTYMIGASVRFGDIYVPGTFSDAGDGKTYAGKWKRAIFFGRGVGGKHLTGMDLTQMGAFTAPALSMPLPKVLWNRGNPDTFDGVALSPCGSSCNDLAGAGSTDYAAYAKMGETWSVPALARVKVADSATPPVDVNFTTRKAATAGGVTFMLYVGSGFTDVDTEGSTFYALDALTGDVVHSKDVGDRSTAAAGIPANLNVIVANAAAFSPKLLAPGTDIPNGANEITTRVFVGDLHGRLWRFYTDDPAFAKTTSTPFADLGDTQPIANAVGLLYYDPSGGSLPKPLVFASAGGDKRVKPTTSTPFKGFGFAEETNGSTTALFNLSYPATPAPGYRGTVQPATFFNGSGLGRVFFVATRLNPPGATCLSTFSSLLAAVGAGTGQAAYDLSSGGDDRFMEYSGKTVSPPKNETGEPTVGVGDRIKGTPKVPEKKPKTPSGQNVFPDKGPGDSPVFRTLSSVCQ